MKKKRSECVFGLHFDFHASKTDKELGGSDFRAEDWEALCREVRPDFLQVDTKGHPGVASYPSELGNAAPEMSGDMLLTLREITEKYGIPLFSHYSGVWDMFQCEQHPEYRAETPEFPNKGETSVFSKYAEDLLIPQLVELAGKYRMDGVWIDGECWSVNMDVSAPAREAFMKEFGRFPELGTVCGVQEYKDFCREAFFRYVRNYVKQVHAKYPDYQIASNWLETSFCPSDTGAEVDMISADYDPVDSLNTARFEARALVRGRKPWELLAWGFNTQNGYQQYKSAVQLEQELAAVYHLGGGAQVYFTEKRGNFPRAFLPFYRRIADFGKQMGGRLHNCEVIPQIGVLFSEQGFYSGKARLFSKWEDETVKEVSGLTLALADLGESVEAVFSHRLKSVLSKYSMLVVPDWQEIEPELVKMIVSYLKEGGKVMLGGYRIAKFFAAKLGFDLAGQDTDGSVYLGNGFAEVGISGRRLRLSGGESLLSYYERADSIDSLGSAAAAYSVGKGRLLVLGFGFGAQYQSNKSDRALQLLGGALSGLELSRLVKVDGYFRTDVVPAVKDGKLLLNLLNLSGGHSNEKMRDYCFVPVLPGVRVEVDVKNPAFPEFLRGKKLAVKCASGREISFKETDGTLCFTLDLGLCETVEIIPEN